MKLIIELDDDIAKGIRGENDCKVEAREIVRSFQATISKAIANGTPYEERPQGEWIRIDDEKVKCPICEVIHLMYSYPGTAANFCPNCGAEMRRGDTE